MFSIKHISIYFCFLFVSACSTTPPVIDKTTKYVGNEIEISASDYSQEPVKNMQSLSIVNRSDTGVGVALKVAEFFISGSASGFDKHDLVGSEIKDLKNKEIGKNPIYEIQKNIKKYIDEYALKNNNNEITEKKYFRPIYIVPIKPHWSLVYDASDAKIKDGYNLNFGVKMVRVLRQKILNNQIKYESAETSCIYKSKPLDLNDWKANDYQKVAEYREIAINTCTKELLQNISNYLVPAYEE